MIDQLNWQKLEHCRDTSRLCQFAFQDFTSPILQVHVTTYDIPAPCITHYCNHKIITRKKFINVIYAGTDVYKYSFFPHTVLL